MTSNVKKRFYKFKPRQPDSPLYNETKGEEDTSMRILVGIQDKETKQFSRVGIYYYRKNGTMSLPMKFHGQMSGLLIRNGASRLASDLAINWVDCQQGSSLLYRISRVKSCQ